ncbi:arabinose-5-phosphate isomerase [Roseivirga ehrenbergii]|uniref:D-arabinose 5-phosphate isomerase n=1 Tax=Roseivirga ehrenbergii (strain DSM 102268 / JCM 13514 / KCTC 12282 / NCIMB 14502 / KMM 6017) TaxID=279360 RepID=A0A150WXE1_ROSEK|nr:KpsF/GutQ family sugar-phosphate isomerase [Roseivirga ehrenbergii]KYG71167.1 D-arabinose 5-phosphate isomerase [Roseivirga ehrenbergii]TCK99036.1 arabinose-5-phosphate isomerase [Roseivirga ehrenbergii]
MKLAKNIQTTAKNTLLKEADAIRQISEFIDEGFEAIVSLILKLEGRVVITGVGKSAIVANKIVATLNSTGTPSLFMHAADAIHGDLGMVQPNDAVICISKSGNTPEIKVLVPLIKRTGAKLIALVSNLDSDLAKQADHVLNATIDKEADPNNLAPTTSTTAHMALGDALAVCLLECRGFTSEDFAKYHPGGSLGKQLYLKVEDIYPKNGLPIVKETDLVKESILEISKKRLGATAVVDNNGKLTGIFTDGDIRRMIEKDMSFEHRTVAEVMTKNPKTIVKGEFALRAMNQMREHSINHLVVLDDAESIVGFIHIQDLINEGIV